MFASKMTTTARMLLLALLASATLVGYGNLRAKPEEDQKADSSKDDKMKRLLKERYDAANNEFKQCFEQFKNKQIGVERCCQSLLRLLESQKDLSDKKADVVTAWECHCARMKESERLAKNSAATGIGLEIDALIAQYFRLDAEIGLERAKAK
jgi:hypothetical protein